MYGLLFSGLEVNGSQRNSEWTATSSMEATSGRLSRPEEVCLSF